MSNISSGIKLLVAIPSGSQHPSTLRSAVKILKDDPMLASWIQLCLLFLDCDLFSAFS